MRVRETEEHELLPWLQKQRKLVDLRYGKSHRFRKLPWKGAANIHTPLIDGIIRRWRPGIASLVLDANPVASFTPMEEGDIEAARSAEAFMTSLFVDKMVTASEVVLLADLFGSRGHAYSREGWLYRTTRRARVVESKDLFPNGVQAQVDLASQQTGQEIDPVEFVSQVLAENYELDPNDPQERQMLTEAAVRLVQGAEYVRLVYREISEDRPSWLALDPVDVIVHPDDDPEDSDFFTIIHNLSFNQLRQRANDGEFDPAVVQRITEKRSSSNDEGTVRSLREQIKDFLKRRRITTVEPRRKRAVIWETYAKMDINGDGLDERVIIWSAPDEGDSILAAYEYPYPFETWPVTVYKFSGDSPRPIDSRGIVELVATFQRLKDEFANARLNASQIVLSPSFKMRTSGVKPKVNWRPGGVTSVLNPDDLTPMTHDLRILNELLAEEQVSQREAETLIGTFDATLTNLSQSRERRTASEVNAITSISSSIFGLDAKMFQTSFSRSLTKVWNLWLEFGQEEMFVRIMGDPNPLRVRKSEIGRDFDIRAAGTPSNTNKAIMLQDAERIMQLVLTPAIAQSGIVNIRELLTYWMQLVDFRLANRITNPEEEAAAVQQVLQAGQLQAEETGAPPPQAL